MRLPKFRVWDKKLLRFMGDGEVTFSDYGDTHLTVTPNSIEYINDSTHNYYDSERWEIIQFTGLLDKNGVEIYEGFIVEITSKVAHTTTKGGVYYDDRVCAFMVDDAIFEQYLPITMEDAIEVIGNIYENGDLLK